MALSSVHKFYKMTNALHSHQTQYAALVNKALKSREYSDEYTHSCDDTALVISQMMTLLPDGTANRSKVTTKTFHASVDRKDIDYVIQYDDAHLLNDANNTALKKILTSLQFSTDKLDATYKEPTAIRGSMRVKVHPQSKYQKHILFQSNTAALYSTSGWDLSIALDAKNEMAMIQRKPKADNLLDNHVSEYIIIFNTRPKLEVCIIPPPLNTAPYSVPVEFNSLRDDLARHFSTVGAIINATPQTVQNQTKGTFTQGHRTLWYLRSKFQPCRYTKRPASAAENELLEDAYKQHLSTFLIDIHRLHYTYACLLSVASALIRDAYPTLTPAAATFNDLVKTVDAFVRVHNHTTQHTLQSLLVDIATASEIASFLYVKVVQNSAHHGTSPAAAAEDSAETKSAKHQLARLFIENTGLDRASIGTSHFGHLLVPYFYENMYLLGKNNFMVPTTNLKEHNTLRNTTSHAESSVTARKWVTTFTLNFSILQYLDLDRIMNPYGDETFSCFKAYNYDTEIDQEKQNYNLTSNHAISVNRKVQQRYQMVFSDYYTQLFSATTP